MIILIKSDNLGNKQNDITKQTFKLSRFVELSAFFLSGLALPECTRSVGDFDRFWLSQFSKNGTDCGICKKMLTYVRSEFLKYFFSP